jgi:ABC-type transport system involved in cytochrome c biogenesis permease subunit
MDAAMIDAKLLLSALLELLPVLYGVAFFDYVLVFATDESMVRRLARPLLMTAVVANLIYLLGFTLYFEHIPLVTVYQALGAVGFSVAATYLFVESRTGTPHTGPFILFLVLVFQILNTLFPKLDRDIPQILGSTLFSFHVSAAVLGYSAFAVAAVYGLLYLMLYHQIRTKSFGLIFRRLPSLDILDRMNFYASVGTWVLYGLAILGRQFTAWKGPRMAYSSLFGFLVVLFSLFAVNFFLTKFHVFVS